MSAVCLLAVAGAASAQLTLTGVRCGQLTCSLGQYCSPDTDRCEPCTEVCNTTHQNYDAGLCVKECQDYIHDLKYISTSQGFKSVEQQARAALIISCVALGVLVLILTLLCLRFFRDKFSFKYWRQKLQPSKNRVKQHPTDLVHHNPHAEMPKVPKAELKLDIINPKPPRHLQPLNPLDLENRTSHTEKSQAATTPKTISTCLSNRHPAEDTTLDYSYDNMGLNVTPPPASAQMTSSQNL